MEASLPRALRVGHHGAVWAHWHYSSFLVSARGDLSAAHDDALAAIEYGRTRHIPWVAYSYLSIGTIALYQGRGSEALQHFRTAVDIEPPTFFHGSCHATLFWALAHERDPGALPFLRQHAPSLPIPGRANRAGAWYSLPLVVEGLAWLGQREAVASLQPRTEALVETGFLNRGFSLFRICAGIAAAAAREWPCAEAHYQTAMQQAASVPYRWAEPQARAWYAEMLLDRNREGDRGRARALLEEAITMYAALGMPGFERRARERLASL